MAHPGSKSLLFTAIILGLFPVHAQAWVSGPIAPGICGQLAGRVVDSGQSATFAVAPSGSHPMSFQWKKNGVAIPGATGPSYTTPPAAPKDSGTAYAVEVTNAAGKVATLPALLIVRTKPDPSLVGFWKLDDAKGDVAVDSSGNKCDGSLAGGPKWATGFKGGALDFDAAAAAVSIPHRPALGPGKFTLSAWVNSRDASKRQCVTAKDDGTNCEFALGIAGSKAFFSIGRQTLSGVQLQEGENELAANQWYYLAGTFDGATMRLYTDGAPIRESAKRKPDAPAVADKPPPLLIGARADAKDACPFNGLIDDVRLYSRALSEAEIRDNSGLNPDFADVAYMPGGDPQTLLDFWKAPSAGPAPVLIYIHGGGFNQGDKAATLAVRQLKECLTHGVSFASVNYPLLAGNGAVEDTNDKSALYPIQFKDCARAVQFLRSKASEWNLDPKRIASCGGSAGGGLSLWIGLRDDMADPKSSDPVARQSTRLTCIAGYGAQASYDPFWFVANLGWKPPQPGGWQRMFGVSNDTLLLHEPKWDAVCSDISMINFMKAGGPPLWLTYGGSPKAKGYDPHHAMFGVKLKEKCDSVGVECVLYTKDTPAADRKESDMHFVFRHFGMTDAGGH